MLATPSLGCLKTIMSTFIDIILLIVSIRDSPFLIEEIDDEKFITSADNLFWANSNDNFVLVLFSKKRFAMVISRRVGTFLIGRFRTSKNLSVVSKIRFKSEAFKSFMPIKFLTLSSLISFINYVNTIFFIVSA